MSKKSIVSPIARIVLGLILAAVFCIFAAKLVDPWINKIGTAKAKDVIWSIITLIAGAVLLISGIAELVRSLHFNRMVTNSGMQVKKVKHATIGDFFKKIGAWFANAGKAVANEFKDIVQTFRNGDWKTKLSFLVMGFGSIARGQVLRGILFLLFEIVFIVYMIFAGAHWLSQLPTLGTKGPSVVYNEVLDQYVSQYNDNSFKILLYGVLTIFFIIAFIYTWRLNVKQNKISEEILKSGKPLKSGKDDLRSLVDDKFHATLLALPLTGIIIFTVLPIIFMILVAFTNYDGAHDGYYNNLFTWVGLKNFNTMLSWKAVGGGQSYAATFGEILTWTLIWAFFATFTNYFLGMFVAMMINKKGIHFKKVWRTILVMTIAIPQFISLLYVSKMFAKNGIVNGFLMDMGWITKALPFWEDPTWARCTVIGVNIWIGIPYLMLIATGILMNIPADLYESAKIDGASGWKQFSKITLPYMLFITGPYLLTSFTGNMNNFNVIYLLTGGGPHVNLSNGAGNPGDTDLLITWLFNITQKGFGEDGAQYYLASVIGILVFIVVAVISLIVYNLLPSVKNEEDFQ
jgi:arabinogalactan oligomer/maltooligosaccharide transport system permease protein